MQYRNKLSLGLVACLVLSFVGCGGAGSSSVSIIPTVGASSPTPQDVIVTGSCSGIQQLGQDADYWLFNLGQVDQVVCSPSSSMNFGVPAPVAGTIAGLAAAANGSSGGVLTVYVNSTPTSVTCTVNGSCRVAGAAAFNAGDVIGVKLHVPAGQFYSNIRAVVVAQQ